MGSLHFANHRRYQNTRKRQLFYFIACSLNQGEQLREHTLREQERLQNEALHADEFAVHKDEFVVREDECEMHVAPKHSEGGTAQLEWVFQFDQHTRYTHMGASRAFETPFLFGT
jgi:hypothetical protein